MGTIKAYKLQHSANLGKRGKIIEVVKAYRILAKPAELVVERLSFRSPDLSWRMNHLLSMFRKSLVRRKLDSLKSSLGITIAETNAAYSSQECSVCGYVAKDNRPPQSQFKCKCCHTVMHADVNAARNHHARSSAMAIDVYQGTQTVLQILTERFLSGMERSTRHYRMAPGLLSSDSYFAGPSAQPKGFLYQGIFCHKNSDIGCEVHTGINIRGF